MKFPFLHIPTKKQLTQNNIKNGSPNISTSMQGKYPLRRPNNRQPDRLSIRMSETYAKKRKLMENIMRFLLIFSLAVVAVIVFIVVCVFLISFFDTGYFYYFCCRCWRRCCWRRRCCFCCRFFRGYLYRISREKRLFYIYNTTMYMYRALRNAGRTLLSYTLREV